MILILLSFLTIYLVWGSTYLFIAFAVAEIPPFLLSSIRYLAAAAILFSVAGAFGHFKEVTFAQIKRSLFIGVLFIGIGSGGVAWALMHLDSGFVALLISSQPASSGLYDVGHGE